MSGGEQQMLAVARALMAQPSCCCSTSRRWASRRCWSTLIFDTIEKIREQGTTVLLVEQNALAALDIADHAYVLESGLIKLEGPADELAHNDEVRKAYLGED